jgi:hypothetical protein
MILVFHTQTVFLLSVPQFVIMRKSRHDFELEGICDKISQRLAK